MSVRLFALTCGWVTGPAEAFLAGESGRLREIFSNGALEGALK